MASNENFADKPNLRPTKRIAANGKTVFLHHSPNQQLERPFIVANWNDTSRKSLASNDNPFGIDQPRIEYSLNKRQRWKVLNSFRERAEDSSDDERDVQSDGEKSMKKSRRQKKKHFRTSTSEASTKYRLYQMHNIYNSTNCVGIFSNVGSQRVVLPQKTYMSGPMNPPPESNNPTREQSTADVTYYAVLSPPRDKQLLNIRKQHGNKKKKATTNIQRPRSPKSETTDDKLKQLETSDEIDFDDDDDLALEIYYGSHPGQLKLDDFIPQVSASMPTETTKKISKDFAISDRPQPKSSRFYIGDIDPSSRPHRFHRQISKEEKRYNRDLANHKKTQNNQQTNAKQLKKSAHHLMSIGFRLILIEKSNLTADYLSKTYGKNFLHANCYPNKSLICLTDRVKSLNWSQKAESFSSYVMLNAYLVIVEIDSCENFQRVLVGLNMDLYCETIEIETLYESTYKLSDVIEKTLEFLVTLPFDAFKPVDSELTRKRIVRTELEADLSESEHLNKKIRQLKIFDSTTKTNDAENLQVNETISLDDYDLIQPDVCTICYRDMDESIPVTALKTCAHWLCNDCWKNYLEASVKRVEIIRCPEWNCDSIVDIGTLLSLTNVRCMNIYERNIENCLVNVSRSYVKCPAKNCSNIVQVIGSAVDHVRCSCSHQFCVQCKEEPHFPATCNAYRFYLEEIFRNGDAKLEAKPISHVNGRNCISCNNFIEKNGGCNHMTCRCGAEFCWTCAAYWKDHSTVDGTFRCPKPSVPLQEKLLVKERSNGKRFYQNAVYHRHERFFQNQTKFGENGKRLLSTIPLEKSKTLDPTMIEQQVGKRESLLRHLYEMAKYIQYLHRICEFLAVAADGYGNSPSEFRNSLQPFEILVLNMSQTFEGGRGYQAIQDLTEHRKKAEKLIERLQHAVALRELRRANTTGYVTS